MRILDELAPSTACRAYLGGRHNDPYARLGRRSLVPDHMVDPSPLSAGIIFLVRKLTDGRPRHPVQTCLEYLEYSAL